LRAFENASNFAREATMIDLATEDPIPLSRIPARFPSLGRHTGKHLHFSTLFRWATKGVRGPNGERVRLETTRLGGSLITSVAALNRFAAALSPHEQGKGPVVSPRSPGKRRKEIERADEELAVKLGG
jgi:hypothetical protein